VKGANIRCGLEAGDGEAVFGGGGDGGTSFQYYQAIKQQYMQNLWDNDSFVFMMLLLKCQLWLDEGREFSL
jgi:hypothetical protein